MRVIAAILLLIMAPSLCFAGPVARRAMGIAKGGNNFTANSINGITAIASGGTQDTGTGTGYLYAGTISVMADCNSDPTFGADVYLVVDGTTRDELHCSGDTGASDTLTYIVTEGTHTARIYGTYGGGTAYFTAGTFSLPVTP